MIDYFFVSKLRQLDKFKDKSANENRIKIVATDSKGQ